MDIIQGQSKPVRIHLVGKVSRDDVDLTGVTFIEVCFPPSDVAKPVDLYYETDKADVDGTTDLLANIADTSHLIEGMLVTGAGIPVNSYVIKTPQSLTAPTASGVVQISNVTTGAPALQVPLLFQNVFIDLTPDKGVIIGKLTPAHTALIKVGLAQTVEVTYITPDGLTHKSQILKVLNVTKSIC